MADIIKSNDYYCKSSDDNSGTDGVVFVPWDHTNAHLTSPSTHLHVIIHKLTEDIHNADIYSKLCAEENARELEMAPGLHFPNSAAVETRTGGVGTECDCVTIAKGAETGTETGSDEHSGSRLGAGSTKPLSLPQYQIYRQSFEKIAALNDYLLVHP